MSDIKLFRTANNKVEELQGRSATIEKSLQAQIERHMEAFIGVRFLAYRNTPRAKPMLGGSTALVWMKMVAR